MSYKTDQCRIVHRGREFHFVSYDGHVANIAKGEVAAPAMWYLMMAGKRYEVMPQEAGQPATERDLLLADWLDTHVFHATNPQQTSPRQRTA